MRPEYLNRIPLIGQTFRDYLGDQPVSSFFIFYSQDKDKVNYRFKNSEGVVKEEICDVPISKKNFSFFLKAADNMISLNYHDNSSNNYSKCAIIDMGKERMDNFYVSMISRCSSSLR